jgi:hypothetical protein
MSYWAAIYRFRWTYMQLERIRCQLVEWGVGLKPIVIANNILKEER